MASDLDASSLEQPTRLFSREKLDRLTHGNPIVRAAMSLYTGGHLDYEQMLILCVSVLASDNQQLHLIAIEAASNKPPETAYANK